MKKQLSCLVIILLFHTGIAVGASAPVGQPSAQTSSSKNLHHSGELTKKQKLEVLRNIDLFHRQISQLESEEGVYGSTLTEKLGSLGIAYQYADEHNKAIEMFKRAIHLNRVNDGLYTTGQVPLLQRLIASHIKLGQWDKVSDKYNYLYWLNTQNYGKEDPRILPTLTQMSKWHLRAYGMQFGKDRQAVTNHLITAHTYIERSIDLLDQHQQTNNTEQRLIKELNGLTLTNYLFATFPRSAPIRAHTGSALDPEVSHSAMVVDHYISRSFRSGKKALNRVIDIYSNSESAPPWAVAKAKVKMADWLFIFNKRSAAFALYQEAYNLMTEHESSLSALKATFDQPVALPNLDLLDSGQYAESDKSFTDKSVNYVLASFDVTPQGNASNIEIIDSKPLNNISARSQVKRSLRITKFRPRFVGGEPILTEKMKLRVLSR
jgi:tetratricopeptide (TPR) repeat protein